MTKIIACIDGSSYVNSICALSAFAAKNSNLEIALLHVIPPHFDSSKSDLSGAIGLGANIQLLEELTKIDEARGKLEQEKGQIMLKHAKAELSKMGIEKVETLHLRGTLPDVIAELEKDAALIVIGKKGEHESASNTISSNLEPIARIIHKPILVVTKNPQAINSFLIAYEHNSSTQKAVEYIAANPLLKNAKCHLLKICDESDKVAIAELKASERILTAAGFIVKTTTRNGEIIEDEIHKYVEENNIDLLAIGAYNHSKIRNFILGSTTTAIIHKTKVPLLLFR